MRIILFLLLFAPALLLSGQTEGKKCSMYTGTIDSATNKLYYTTADIMPAFIDTTFDIQTFFLDHLHLPSKKCSKSEIAISFAVEPDGTITHKKILKKPDGIEAQEILKVLDSIPPMKPGKIKIATIPMIIKIVINIPKYKKQKS